MNVRAWLTLLLVAPYLQAAPGVELAPGLLYQRFQHFPQDLPKLRESLAQPAALVLDLRGVKVEPLAVNLRREFTEARDAKAPLRLVLVNSDSSPAILTQLPLARTHAVALAPRAAGTVADVAVDVSLEDDQKAVAALTQGSSPLLHLPAPVNKEREDEQSLTRAHAGLPKPTPSPSPTPDELAKAPLRQVDPVLTRAVQLFQAWQALQTPPASGEPKAVDEKNRG